MAKYSEPKNITVSGLYTPKTKTNNVLQALYESKILWHTIAECPNCLPKVKEGLKNQPLPRFDEQNEIHQGSI